MKRFLGIITASLLSVAGMAQSSELVGTWQMLGNDGQPTTSVKVFMPDGRQLGLSFSRDFSNNSVWFMSNYKMLTDTTYVDHAFYHSDILYQRDFFFTFHKENDSLLVTSYVDFGANGYGANRVERWKKMAGPMPSFNDAEWEALHHKSLVEFDRLPKEGQTVEQYGKELYDRFQSYKNANNLDRANEALLIRAELDTTNLKWQRDLVEFYLEKKAAPSVADNLANRIIRLTEAQAPTAKDTSVVNAYRIKAYLYNYRGNAAMPQVRSIMSKVIEMETTAGHQPSKDFGLDYFVMAMSYLPEGNLEKVYEYAMKSIDIFEKAPDVSDNQKAEAYATAGVTLMLSEQREREAIELLKKAASLFSGESAFKIPSMVYPAMFTCYDNLLDKNPKDKKLKKEVKQFMSDKLIYDVFEATDSEHNLRGEYLVLEMGDWTLENPTASVNGGHYLLRKGDEYRLVEETKEGEKLGGASHVRPVDAATKKEVIRHWKAYRKQLKK